MQGMVVGIILTASLVGLTGAMLAWRRSGAAILWTQLIVGVAVGGITAAVVVALRTDLVPDELEVGIAIALVIVAAVSIAPLVLHRSR